MCLYPSLHSSSLRVPKSRVVGLGDNVEVHVCVHDRSPVSVADDNDRGQGILPPPRSGRTKPCFARSIGMSPRRSLVSGKPLLTPGAY